VSLTTKVEANWSKLRTAVNVTQKIFHGIRKQNAVNHRLPSVVAVTFTASQRRRRKVRLHSKGIRGNTLRAL